MSVARGTRLTVVVPREDHGEWERRALAAGLFELPADAIGISHLGASETVPWGADGLERRTLEGGYRIFIGGTARYASSKITLDHDVAEPFMDPRDRGIGCEAPERKTERSYQPIPHDPARWLGKGFSFCCATMRMRRAASPSLAGVSLSCGPASTPGWLCGQLEALPS